MEAGEYYLEDHNAAQLLWAGGCFGNVRLRHDCFPKPSKIADEIIVVRVGGFGDLLWLNAVYRALREKHPGIKIHHCAFAHYLPVMEGFIDSRLNYPLSILDTKGLQVHWLENIIEGEPCVTEHPCDRIARRFGLDPLPQKSVYDLRQDETEWAQAQFPRTKKKRVCVQMSPSTGNKEYLVRVGGRLVESGMLKVMGLLYKWGHEIVIVGDARQNKEAQPEGVFDCTQRQFTIRQSIAMASQCDVILGADSVFVHVGAALDIPVVGLFGPFHGESYMVGQRGTIIQGRWKCSPCSHHPRGTPFPEHGPCAKSGYCTALAQIAPGYVAQMVRRWL